MVQRVPFTGEEKTSLHVSLDRHRDVVLWKLEGLDDDQLRAPMTPSGTTLLGLVKHLAAVEYGWFCQTFGRQTENLPFDEEDPEADLRVTDHESTADVLAFYSRARTAADDVIRQLDLEGRRWRRCSTSAAGCCPRARCVAGRCCASRRPRALRRRRG